MHRWIVCAMLVGCTEYTLPQAPQSGWGDTNPADVGSTEQVDRILQVVEPVVDVLWVIDSSPSMADDRWALAAAFPKFIAPFEEAATDWHVGVITTDMVTESHRGKLQERQGVRWLSRDTPDFGRLFTSMTAFGNSTSTTEERGREATWSALEIESEGFNTGFLRDDPSGYLHITVVSDEDDDTDDQELSISRFADYIELVRPYRTRTTFNSVVAMEDAGPERRGDAYMALTDTIGGQIFDINEGNWTSLLDQLGGMQAPEPLNEFFLSRLPVPETLQVSVIDNRGVTFVYLQDIDYTWTRSRNSLLFLDGPPTVGSTVEVRYTVSAAD